MNEVKQMMIGEFLIRERGYDFMGYRLNKKDSLTFHHLIIPKRKGGLITRNNGAIIQRIPHDYLHLIESIDYEIFYYLTSEMIDMNVKGYLDRDNLINIRLLLEEFESKHDKDLTKKGRVLIKTEYKQGRVF